MALALAAVLLTPATSAAAPVPVRFVPSTSAGNATGVTWGFRFEATATVDPTQNQTITVTGPVGSFSASASGLTIIDLTTGANVSTGADVATDGGTMDAKPSATIQAGDLLAVDAINVTNPAPGAAFTSVNVSPSTGNTAQGAFTAPQSVSMVAFTTSTTAAGATGVTWGFRFRASATGALPGATTKNTVTVTAPAGASFSATGGARLVDLTTFTNEEVSVQTSQAGRVATVSPVSFAHGDLLQLDLYSDTNPAAGPATFNLATQSDTVPAQTAATTFTAPKSVGSLRFTTNNAAAGATANWGLAFTTSSTGRLAAGGSIVLSAPSGTTFPTSTNAYTVRDESTGGSYLVHAVSPSSTGVTLTGAPSGFDTIRAGDLVSVDIQGVTNPAGGISPSGVSVSTSSDPTPVTASAPPSSAGGSIAGLQLVQTGRAGGASGMVWTAQFEVSATGGLAAHSGTITFTAPAGTFTHNASVAVRDLTSGGNCCTIATVSPDGTTVQAQATFTIAPGDMLELEVHQTVNPTAGSYLSTAFGVSTSSDPAVAHPASAVTFTASKSPTDVRLEPTTFAGGASETTWAAMFTASSTGGMADDGLQDTQIKVQLPPSAAIETERCSSVYDMTTGASIGCGGSFTNNPATVTQLQTPSAISPGDALAVVIGGVTNPAVATYPGSDVTLTTSSDTQPGHAAAALTFTPPNLPTTDLLTDTEPTGAVTTDRVIGEFATSATGEIASARSQWGSVTLQGPAGVQFQPGNSGCVFALDLSTGTFFCDTPVSTSGSAVTIMPVAIGAGDVVELSVGHVTRPANVSVPTGFRVSTSSDDGAPTASPVAVNAVEGASFTAPVLTINGSCPPSGTIGWGDGSPSSAASVSCQGLIATLSGTHTYAEFGTYAISVTASDGSSGAPSATVSDATLSGSPVTGLTATAGAPFSGAVARFTDANPFGKASDFSATIDWGDGTTSAGTIIASQGGFAVNGTHTYAAAANDTIVVHIADAGGSTASAVESITVNAPGAPKVTLVAPANGATVTTGTPKFSGAADTAPADAPNIKVNIYAGGAVSNSPVQTLSTTATGGSWSVSTSAALANGTYTAQAQQSTTTGVVGFSAAHVFTINAPAPPPPPPPHGPGSGGGPPPGCTGTAQFAVIDAIGCLQTPVDQTQIPDAEKRMLCNDLDLKTTRCENRLEDQIKSRPGSLLLGQALVRVNGLDLNPEGGAMVVLDSAAKRVLVSRASVEIMGDKLALYSGPLDLDGSKQGDVPALDVNLDKLRSRDPLAAAALDLGSGFGLTGTLATKLGRGTTQFGATVQLAGDFSAIGFNGSPLSAQTTATADNSDNVQFNELYFAGPDANLLDSTFELHKLAFCYQNHISDNFCQNKTHVGFGDADPSLPSWNTTGQVELLGISLDAAPPPPTYGLGFVGGGFAFGGMKLSIVGGVPIAPGVKLNALGASLAINPLRETGEVGLSIADTAHIDGHVFFVAPGPGHPYHFTGDELGPGTIQPPLSLPHITATGPALAAGGKVFLNLPFIGEVPLGSGFVQYAYPSYIGIGGGFDLNLFTGALVIDGGIQGAVNLGNGRPQIIPQFDVEGGVEARLNVFGLNTGFGAWGVVSTAGFGACGEAANVIIGVGYKWGTGLDGIQPMLGSCDLTPYQVAVSASSARGHAAGSARIASGGFRVPGGLPNEMIKVTGSAGPPDVTVSGPGGLQASSAGQTNVREGPFWISRDAATSTTYIGVIHPPGGQYTVTANPGSPPIAQILTAHGFTPKVKARVTKSRTRRALHYKINMQRGEKVTFVERGKNVQRLIGSVKKGHGTLTFTPAPGPGGVRQIVASIVENGAPVVVGHSGQIVVASYHAPGPRRLGAIHGLRARRHGSRVAVTFARVRGAKRYVVLVTMRSGLRTDRIVRKPRARLSVPVVGPPGGTVEVRALGDGLTTLDGRLARAKVKVAHHRPKHRHH